MTPEDLYAETAQRAGVSRYDAQRIVCAAFDLMTTLLAQRTRVVLTGFGSFETRVNDSGHAYPAFSAGQLLKDAVKAVPDPSPDPIPSPEPVPPPVPLTLDPSLIPLRRQQIENQYQGYRERREQVVTSLKLRTEQGNAELMKLYRYQVDRLDKEITSMLATMTERARQESTELMGMSRNALCNEIARLRDLTAAYEHATDAAFALYEGLNDAAQSALERHGVPQDVLKAFFGTLNALEMALVSDKWAREQAEDASSSSAAW